MLPLSFLFEVLSTVPLPISFHATVETRSLVIAVLPCQSCFYLLLPFAPLGGKGYLPLLLSPTNKKDLALFLLKVPLGSSKHVQQLGLGGPGHGPVFGTPSVQVLVSVSVHLSHGSVRS